MRYYRRGQTLILRGEFRAACTGIPGGLGKVPTILIHHPAENGNLLDPSRIFDRVLHREGLPPDFFGLVSGHPITSLCILQHDFLTLFISAGAPGRDRGSSGPVTMVVHSREGMSDSALLESIMTATAARMEAMQALGRPLSGDPADGVIVASEGEVVHRNAGISTAIGEKIRPAVLFGVREALARVEEKGTRDRPSFFIFSRYQGEHWVEWIPEECPYYPCHFPGQRCEFCYCPFYPCGDESLGEWAKSSSKNGPVWNCSGCTLLHEPVIADYLLAHPEASLTELKRKKSTG